ncbi:alpha-galactosidase [Cellulomonas sp. McL0617]|uniref:alpha-galactosidase n=1 Tax=Cellulomonas sp. McL0617 TaxID=3415675 RepID=UPI003CF48EF2
MSRLGIEHPPQGWNSWDCFGTTVTEDEVLANAEVLASRLLPVGYDTVVVDIDWYDPTARSHGYQQDAPFEVDAHGYPAPAPGRFPSSAGGAGFALLAEKLHAMGLRFGVHLMRGIPRRAVALDLPVLGTDWTASQIADTSSTCAWHPGYYGLDHSHPGAQAYLDGFASLLASWGLDYLKIDDMLAPYHADAIEAWRLALDRAGRPIVLSLSPGTALSTAHVRHLRRNADLWRISNDLWDRWSDVEEQFGRLSRWAPLQSPRGWADADMLPLGRIGVRAERGEPRDSLLTPDEQRTLLTLWAMARSPFMIGGNLPETDDATLDRLANPALGRVLQESVDGSELWREPVEDRDDGEVVVWAAREADGPARFVAVFWTGPTEYHATVALQDVLGDSVAAGHGAWTAHDLWDSGVVGVRPDLTLALDVPAHGVRWLELTRS